MSCHECGQIAVYRCSACGGDLCAGHAKLWTACASCVKKQEVDYELTMAASTEHRARIRELVRRFWGEEEQLAFDRRYVVSDLPTWVAKSGRRMIGFVSFADLKDDLLIVALGVLAQYQNAGIGRSLVEKAESEARKSGKRRLLVATSNDDLPALAFYQFLGFSNIRRET